MITPLRPLTDIWLKDEDILPRFKQKLRANVDELRKKFSRFDDAPGDVQFGLLDMQYNMGNKFQRDYIDPKTKEKKGWPQFFDAYEKKDWKTMAAQSHRTGIQDKRNATTFDLFNETK